LRFSFFVKDFDWASSGSDVSAAAGPSILAMACLTASSLSLIVAKSSVLSSFGFAPLCFFYFYSPPTCAGFSSVSATDSAIQAFSSSSGTYSGFALTSCYSYF
jgi:hypothetical protein